jgi:RNA polymerase sigma factor (sigma-70 family)
MQNDDPRILAAYKVAISAIKTKYPTLPMERVLDCAADGLMAAVKRYDPARQSKLNTYAHLKAIYAVASAARDEGKNRNVYRRPASVEIPICARARPATPDITRHLSAFIDALPKRSQRIMRLRIEGRTMRQIGPMIGLSCGRVAQIVSKIHAAWIESQQRDIWLALQSAAKNR